MGKCKGVPSSGGVGKLLNGVPWKYTTFDKPIKPIRTVGSQGYMEPFGDFSGKFFPEDSLNNISAISYEWLSDYKIAWLYSDSASVYLAIMSYDLETNQFKLLSKTLIKTLSGVPYLITSKILKISDNQLTLMLCPYLSNSYLPTDIALWSVYYVKVTLDNNNEVTISKTGYIDDANTSRAAMHIMADATYDSVNDTVAVAYILGNYDAVYIQFYSHDTMGSLSNKSIGNILSTLTTTNSNDVHPIKQVKLAYTGRYVVLAVLSANINIPIHVFDNRTVVYNNVSAVGGDTSRNYANCVDILPISDTEFVVGFWISNTAKFRKVKKSGSSFSTVPAVSNTLSKFSSWQHTNARLLKSNNGQIVAFAYAMKESSSQTAGYYSTIDFTDSTMTTSGQIILLESKQHALTMFLNRDLNRMFINFKDDPYCKLKPSTFDVDTGKLIYKSFKTFSFDDIYQKQITDIIGTLLSEDEVVVVHRTSTTNDVVSIMRIVNNNLIEQCSLQGLTGVPKCVSRLSDTDFIVITHSYMYLIRKDTSGSISIIKSLSGDFSNSWVLEVLNPKLFLVITSEKVYPYVVESDDSLVQKNYILSDGTNFRIQAVRLTDTSFLCVGWSSNYVPTSIVTFNSDYTVKTKVLEGIPNQAFPYRLSKRQFIFLPDQPSSGDTVTLVTLTEDLSQIESSQSIAWNNEYTSIIPEEFYYSNNNAINPYNNFSKNYAPYACISLRSGGSASYYKWLHCLVVRPNGNFSVIGNFSGFPVNGVMVLSSHNSKYMIMYTLPQANYFGYYIGTIEDILKNNCDATHLVTSKISKGKYSKSYAIGGTLNDEYPY